MLPESREVNRLLKVAQRDLEDLSRARTNSNRAGAIGRARLTLDALAYANIAERYALAADQEGGPS